MIERTNRDLTLRAIETLKGEMNNLSMRDMLDLIDLFLNRRDQESANLIAVLTALRGCDVIGETAKLTSTCVIRAVALPLTCPPYNNCPPYYDPSIWWAGIVVGDGSTCMGRAPHGTDLSKVILEKRVPGNIFSHFNTHARMAAEALGLAVEYQK